MKDTIIDMVLYIYAEHTLGRMFDTMDPVTGETRFVIDTPDETMEFGSRAEAATEALHAIREWVNT